MINELLATIQAELNAPKNQRNSFGGYNYRSCEDILEAVKPLLAKTKTTLTITDEIVCVGARYYIKATATLTSNDGEIVSASAYAREAESKKGMDEAQVTGATSSYARKYALNGLFAIDDNKDADTINTHGKAEEPATNDATESLATQEQVAEIFNLKCNVANIRKAYNITRLAELTYSQANEVIAKKKASMGANNEN